jgi:hypothetical protein
MRQMQTLALISRDLHKKGLVPDVPNVPLVEDVPEVIILPELWRKTSGSFQIVRITCAAKRAPHGCFLLR